MQLKVKQAFKWAHRHVDVKEHKPGDVIDTDDKDLIRVATEEGWVAKVKDAKEPKPEATKAATPEPVVEPAAGPEATPETAPAADQAAD